MEQPQYLIDTNAVIDYLGKKLPSTGMSFMNNIIDAVPNISIITKIELLGLMRLSNIMKRLLIYKRLCCF